ncbi:MAG: OmpA family protein [Cytophagales bacterium]|nr:OmpA family protein [Cytophaga sp.]
MKIFFLAMMLCGAALTAYSQNEKQYIKDADAAVKKNDRKTALNLYLQAYSKNQNNAETNYKIGRLYLTSTYTHKSLSFLEKAYQIDPKVEKDINLFLGMAYQFNLKFDQALECFTKYRSMLSATDTMIVRVDRKIYECNNGKEFLANPVPVKIESVGNVINSAYADFGAVISADEQVLIFTSRRPGSTGELLDLNGNYFEDIYISNKVNGKWGTPKNIGPTINTDRHDASIAISADGLELLIYKDEGQGDIYYCKKRKDDTWSKPMPIEGSINNRNHYENSAALSPDGKTLFFASNRDGGFGKTDIYMVTMDEKGVWSKPVNLGPTINTAADEEGPFMDFDGTTLYFSSRSHKGMGGFDIFKTYYDSSNSKWMEPINMGYPINSADDDIYFVLSGDGAHGYYASAKEDGLGEQDIYIISMPPREDREALIKKMKAMNLKTVEIENPVVQHVEPAEVTSAVVLLPVVIKGVVKDVGNGKPIQSNVQLTDASGAIVSTVSTSADGLFAFEVSNEEAKSYTISTEKDGYGFINKTFSVPANKAARQEITQNLALKTLAVGNVFVLRNIYFDFDKSTIKPQSNKELNDLLHLLKNNPSLKVEISGHTDSKGDDEYNMQLSANRAKAVVGWLTGHGISKDRMTSKGYGESRPLATNDDEEEGRELNRRTEFKILKN